jgi:hypothetical protein
MTDHIWTFGAGLLSGIAVTLGAIVALLRRASDSQTDPHGDRRHV